MFQIWNKQTLLFIHISVIRCSNTYMNIKNIKEKYTSLYQVGSENNLFLNGQVFPKYNEIILLYEDIKKVLCTGNFASWCN